VGERGPHLGPVLVLDRLIVPAERVVEHSGQDPALCPEVPVDGRLRDAGGVGDRVHRGRAVPACDE
jgi:hypothetical protein